jgi:hypothetical protein
VVGAVHYFGSAEEYPALLEKDHYLSIRTAIGLIPLLFFSLGPLPIVFAWS